MNEQHFFFLMLAYAYDYRTEFKLSKLNLKLILGFFFYCSLFFNLCFFIVNNTYIKVLFYKLFSFANTLVSLFSPLCQTMGLKVTMLSIGHTHEPTYNAMDLHISDLKM